MTGQAYSVRQSALSQVPTCDLASIFRRALLRADLESGPLGRVVQVDPMKPKLKPPGTKRLKLEYDGLLSNFGFKFSLRRYIWVRSGPISSQMRWHTGVECSACAPSWS